MRPTLLSNAIRLVSSEDPERILAFASALERGTLSLSSPLGEIQDVVGVSHDRLAHFKSVMVAAPTLGDLVLTLRAAVEASIETRSRIASVEVAWTYPKPSPPGLRTTGGVSREIIRGCEKTLLVIGYSVTVDSRRTGLAAQTINEIGAAGSRGVVVTAVLHRQANREALLDSWPAGVNPPSVFTWPESRDPMASVHAKVLVGDRRDALVTSANLSYHGYEGNLEMGLRVTGGPAAEIHDRFFSLIRSGDLVDWRDINSS